MRSTPPTLMLFLALGALPLGCSRQDAAPPPQAEAPPATADATTVTVSEILEEENPYRRAARLASHLENLGPEGVDEVQDILRGAQIGFGMAELELLVRYWARYAPEDAAKWGFMSGPPGCNLASIRPTFEAWATADPRAVAEFIRSGGPLRGPEVRPAEVALITGWFASGEDGLTDYIRDMGISYERQLALGQFAAMKIERDGPAALIEWAEALPDHDQRFKLTAFRQAAAELGKVDPEAAVAFCAKHCDGPYGSNVRTKIAIAWGARDGKAALEWLSKEPEGPERDKAVASAFQAFVRRDYDDAVAYIQALDPATVEPWLQPAVGRFAMVMRRNDPREALEWAALIPDEKRRESALITIARRWRYDDPAAAESWLLQSDLSEEAREKARTAPEGAPPMPEVPTS